MLYDVWRLPCGDEADKGGVVIDGGGEDLVVVVVVVAEGKEVEGMGCGEHEVEE